MAVDITKLVCIHPDTNQQSILDLTDEESSGKAWYLQLPEDTQGHELVSCTSFHRGGKPQAQYQPDQDYLCISMFIATPGRTDMKGGDIKITWELHDQQLDFLISYLENLDLGNVSKPLIINFCDESPKLNDILPQIYSCMQLYNISSDKVILSGMNFDGQSLVNNYAKKENCDPLKYVVMWNMTGHMDWRHTEPLVERHFHSDNYKNPEDPMNTYSWVENPDKFWQQRTNTYTFLNRRFARIRVLALWSLYIKDVWKFKGIVSAFPPNMYHKIGVEDRGVLDYLTKDFLKGMLETMAPSLLDSVTDENFAHFLHVLKVGKTMPGDHDFIGGDESRYAPNMEDSYLWYAIETVADQSETNTFYTEKFLKPMLYGQGLIAYAQPGMVTKFKQLGFHTLAEELGFSEDYDNELDQVKRMDMISDEIAKLCKVPLSEMHERWLSAKDKVLHNQKMIACQLTNLRANYWDKLCDLTNQEIRQEYNSDQIMQKTTQDVINSYQKLFVFENFSDN